MNIRNVTVDFSKKSGKMRPLNSLNSGPLFGIDMSLDYREEYRSLCVPFVRTDRVEYPHGSDRYVDIHCLFPDFSLEERFEASYNFAPTDRYLLAIKDTGAEIFLRLGETADPYEIKPYIKKPKDILKWARVCEKIIAHYNEGWGHGFKLGIKYVEIMCDIDEPDGWQGNVEEYFELYRVVANHLRQRFPRLRIGAYSSGGFFALNHWNGTPLQKGYVETLEKFLDYIGSKETSAPLDFLSWKCTAANAEELSLHANYAKNYLIQSGFRRAQSILTRFDILPLGELPRHKEREYPSRLLSALITAQKSSIDMLFLAEADPRAELCSLYCTEDRASKHYFAPYRAMEIFGQLYRLGTEVETDGDYRKELSTLAATDGTDGAILLVTRDYSGIIEVDVKGANYSAYTLRGLIGGGQRGEGYYSSDKPAELKDGRLLLRVGKHEVYLISFLQKV